MASKKRYWRAIEELQQPELKQQLAENEFPEEVPVDEFLGDQEALESSQTSRRDFLKFLGFSTAAATLAACEGPIVKSVPYVVKPEEVTPGIPNYYASSMFDGYDYANVLIKTREGRPIKIEPNKDAAYFGTTNARVQASVLSLYDSNRAKMPTIDGKNVSWEKLDNKVKEGLAKAQGKKVVILTPSLPSPSTLQLINDFSQKHNAEHVVFDAVDYTAALDAAEEVFGKRALPYYDLTKAKLVVSFNADFLGDWNGGGMDKAYAEARKPGPDMLRHIQVESNLSLTGSNADTRYPAKPSQTYAILAEVYEALSGGAAKSDAAKAIVKELQANGGNAVVFADGNKDACVLAHLINQKLNSQVATGQMLKLKQSNAKQFDNLLASMKAGQVGALFMYLVNPIYASAKGSDFEQALTKVPMAVAMHTHENDTTNKAKYTAPVHHWLESWGDFEPVSGVYSLQQPTIQPIFDTRQFQDSLLTWMESDNPNTNATAAVADSLQTSMSAALGVTVTQNYYDYLKAFAESNFVSKLGYSFNQALYNGANELPSTETLTVAGGDGAAAVQALKKVKSADWEVQFYTKPSMGDGTQATNPWLQELPDPITRTAWDNYFTMNPLDAQSLGIELWNSGNERSGRMSFYGEYYKANINGVDITAPVFVQPGQARGTLGIAFGYGTKGKIAEANELDQIGVNAFPAYLGSTTATVASLTKVEGQHKFANIQMMNTLMGRYEIAREASLDDFLNESPEHWNEQPTMPTFLDEKTPVGKVDLWRSFDRSPGMGPHFKLSVDMNACTGCGACVVACQAENNVPVVGKEEIRRSRDMYWLRIDRYYSDVIQDETGKPYTQKEALKDETRTEVSQYKELVQPAAENPDVIFQPMMCQHCNHAPCETVCPVAATSHGRQGQNMMAYNRCVGTRYCANNCPYKVRRFNWFNYAQNDKFDFNMNNDLGRMVLNPDVVVRQRGVMEKCSMCIQMTQASILKAKREQRAVKDEEFQTACANACPSGALTFGDVNDSESQVAQLEKDVRKYEVLEDVGTKPNVFYHVKIRNRKNEA